MKDNIEQAAERAIQRAIENMQAELNALQIAQNEKRTKPEKAIKQPTPKPPTTNVTSQ
jgi:hypothetical protein